MLLVGERLDAVGDKELDMSIGLILIEYRHASRQKRSATHDLLLID